MCDVLAAHDVQTVNGLSSGAAVRVWREATGLAHVMQVHTLHHQLFCIGVVAKVLWSGQDRQATGLTESNISSSTLKSSELPLACSHACW